MTPLDIAVRARTRRKAVIASIAAAPLALAAFAAPQAAAVDHPQPGRQLERERDTGLVTRLAPVRESE